MDLFKIVIRKMLKNKWLIGCMLIGLVVSVALIGSIPMYTQAVLQKSLIKDMENYQLKNQSFPGSFLLTNSIDISSMNEKIAELEDLNSDVLSNEDIRGFYGNYLSSFKQQDQYISNTIEDKIGLPVIAKVFCYSTSKMKLDSDTGIDKSKGQQYAALEALTGLDGHIALVDGRMPSKEPVDGVYEALVSESALRKQGIVLDKVLVLSDVRKKWGIEPVLVKPVGVFTIKESSDPYWSFFNPDMFSESYIIDAETFRKDFIDGFFPAFYIARWYFAFDYHSMTVERLGSIYSGYSEVVKDLEELKYKSGISITAPAIKQVVFSYSERSQKLIRMLWSLNAPLIIMLCLYLFMISKLLIDREKNEISLLASRGANRLQIVLGYLIEGLTLGGIALITGPFIGMLVTRFLGVSDGFLEFTKRKALEVHLSADVYLYAGMTVCFSIITILIPAFTASKTSIVDHKRKITRFSRFSFWEKLMLDVILLGIAAYGYYSFNQRQELVKISGISATDVQVDPLMFLVPVLFILGCGLLMLRLYPYVTRIVYAAGKSLWSPSVYSVLIQVSRSFRNYHFLMIFLMLTLSVGIFSAVSARTINLNSKEKVFYTTGCDMALEPFWEIDRSGGGAGPVEGGSYSGATTTVNTGVPRYFEPSFMPYTQIDGVEHAAKVFIRSEANAEAGGQFIDGIDLMGIEPYDFGTVAWFRNGLLKGHINEYLNLLAEEQSACLVSGSMSRKFGIKQGDYIQVGWPGTEKANMTVYGIVDYWPGWNPNIKPDDNEKKEPMLLIGNLQYIQDHLLIEPYQVWLKLKTGATSKQVYEDIENKNLNINRLTDANQKLIELKNNPFQLAINGAMTLGFIISSLVCLFGFLLYWIISIKSRTLQFGIFRAMGLSSGQLFAMVVIEQLLTSAAAVLGGLLTGFTASRLFVPFFQAAFDAYSQVPPFKVVSTASDRMKVYTLIGITIGTGLVILGVLLSRIRINHAIKLGED